MDFKNVKSLTIPEGVVTKITSNGVVLWTAQSEEPIWTWVQGESTTGKRITAPDDFDVTTTAVKLTLSVKVSQFSLGKGTVLYYDENDIAKTMSFQEDEKFTITAKLNDGHIVDIRDGVGNTLGFYFYHLTGSKYIPTAFMGTYEPTEVTLWDVEFIKPKPAGELIAEWWTTTSSFDPGSVPEGYFTISGTYKSLSDQTTIHTSTGDVTTKCGLKLNSAGRVDYNISGEAMLMIVTRTAQQTKATPNVSTGLILSEETTDDLTTYLYLVTDSGYISRGYYSAENSPIVYMKLYTE